MEKNLQISNFPGLYREDTEVREKYFLVEQVKTRCINFGWQVDPHFHVIYIKFSTSNQGQQKYISMRIVIN